MVDVLISPVQPADVGGGPHRPQFGVVVDRHARTRNTGAIVGVEFWRIAVVTVRVQIHGAPGGSTISRHPVLLSIT
jgi:hypothetical protein